MRTSRGSACLERWESISLSPSKASVMFLATGLIFYALDMREPITFQTARADRPDDGMTRLSFKVGCIGSFYRAFAKGVCQIDSPQSHQ